MPDITSQTIEFGSQILLPSPAALPSSAVRLAEFQQHTNRASLHLPPGGLPGQFLVMTANGPAWVTLNFILSSPNTSNTSNTTDNSSAISSDNTSNNTPNNTSNPSIGDSRQEEHL